MAFPVVAAVAAAVLGAANGLTLAKVKQHGGNPKCVVWHSQHKSAGRKIENTLGYVPMLNGGVTKESWQASRYCKLECDRESWDCDKQTCTEEKWGYDCDPQHQRIAIKGYTPRLSGSNYWGSPGDGKCVWATMSREPVSRLISAYFYCKNEWDKDPLCGYNRLVAADATVHEWAKHWGNYLFREMMWHPELYAMAQSRASYNANSSAADCHQDPWVQFKDRLNGGDDLSTEDGRANFAQVKAALESDKLYDAYGVVEMWNETMALWDDYFPLENAKWAVLGNLGTVDHGSSKWRDEEHKALDDARKDPVVLEALAGDIALYNDVIVPKFQRYVAKHALAQKSLVAMNEECSRNKLFCDAKLEETQTLLATK